MTKETLTSENAQLRHDLECTIGMARRYADGRSTYAPDVVNRVVERMLARKQPINPGADGIIWARDGWGRKCDGLTEAQATAGTPEALGLSYGNTHPHATGYTESQAKFENTYNSTTPKAIDLSWYDEEEPRKVLWNLLAALNRDGGHYRQEHGEKEAIEKALRDFYRALEIE